MLFRQLVHRKSSTFTYLIASKPGGEALFIDPVADHVDLYLRLLEALELRLMFALDSHSHTDHASALPLLREHTECVTAAGGECSASHAVGQLSDGAVLDIDGLSLEARHTPGHTPDSYSFVMDDRVFTGDTLLIRGTGRTDQGGDARQQYESLFGKLLSLPGRTLVYPAHDYHGRHVSSIAEERQHNPRLQVQSVDDYVAWMEQVRPEDPALADVVEPSSLRPSGMLMRELRSIRAALSPAGVPASGVPAADLLPSPFSDRKAPHAGSR